MNSLNKQEPVALITGAARRIGAAIAKYLQQHGYRVVIHYHHSQTEATALAQELCLNRKESAITFAADLTDKKSLYKLITQAVGWAGRLDLLVNNASLFLRTNLTSPDDADWQRLFTTNVQAPFWLSHAAFPYLSEHCGVIINITDLHADKPLKNYAVYCQTKAALAMQTQVLAREFAPKVRVNAVAPGAIAWPEANNTLDTSIQQKIIAQTPLKCHGNPIYIAKAVLALAENPFVTGETLRVDGGRSLT